MSNYKNFIQDFPTRWGQILIEFEEQAQHRGREVTLVLAIAAVAIIIPLERLRKPPDGVQNPFGDKEKYKKATGKFNEISDKKFLQSILWENEVESWKIGIVDEKEVKNEPEKWAISSRSLPSEVKVKEILKHIRNALAHGNIFTLSDKNNQIENIIFLSRIMNDSVFSHQYSFLTVSPENFNQFLAKWVIFIRDELKLPNEVIDDSEWISSREKTNLQQGTS
jgi:hypothetical protein